MFEAVIMTCLAGMDQPCRAQLVPGFEASSKLVCETELKRSNGPEGSFCQPAGEVLSVEEVAPGLFVHQGDIAEPSPDNRGDVSNLGFIIGADSVAVIDSGSARWIGEALWRAIKKQTDKPVSHVILTHMHPDHVFGAAPFAEAGAEIVGHQGLARAIAERSENYQTSFARLIGDEAFLGSKMTKVTVTVDDEMRLDLGTRMISLQAWPAAHTGTDLTVFDHKTSVLLTGDLVFDQHIPALDGSVLGWVAVLDSLTELEAAWVVPGHGGPLLPWPEGAANQMRYLDVLIAESRDAISQGLRLGEAVTRIASSEEERWSLFSVYNPRNATVAYTQLEWE